MARDTMTALIAQVRDLIADPEGDVFPDDVVEVALDQTRLTYRYFPLRAEPTYGDQNTTYLTYYHPDTGWEADYEVVDGHYDPVTDDGGSEPLLGAFRFTESQDPPLFVSGKTYDKHEAAAMLCERWAQRVALDFDFSTDSGSFSRSQKASTLRSMAASFRALGKPARMSLLRYDEEG